MGKSGWWSPLTNKPLHPQCRRLIILEYEGELYRVEVEVEEEESREREAEEGREDEMRGREKKERTREDWR